MTGSSGLLGSHRSSVHLDESFAPFRSPEFDAAAYASDALRSGGSAQQQLEQLATGIALLDAELRAEVLRRQDALIAQTGRLGEAEASVQRVALSVRSLQSVAARVRAEVVEPYDALSAKTAQLANLQATVDLLRHVIHRLKLVARLRQQLASDSGSERSPPLRWPPPLRTRRFRSHHCHRTSAMTHNTLATGVLELTKAAKLLSDVAAVDAELDTSGLAPVDADAPFLEEVSGCPGSLGLANRAMGVAVGVALAGGMGRG